MGSIASQEMLQRIATEKAEAEAAAKAAKQSAVDLRATLMEKFGKGLKTEVQVNPDGQLAETLTSKDLEMEIKRRGGITFDPSVVIEMPEATELGDVVAELTLHPEVSLTMKMTVEKSK